MFLNFKEHENTTVIHALHLTFFIFSILWGFQCDTDIQIPFA